jgi:HlyD family secretion protein
LNGTVLQERRAGEYVAAGTPVVTIADLREVWLRVHPETDLGKVRLGQEVVVTTDSNPGRNTKGESLSSPRKPSSR